MTMLCDLAKQYGTDKGARVNGGWDYTPIYHDVLEERHNRVTSVLEIGICGFRDIPNNVVGASLFMWRDYFPQAKIFGLDNDSRFVFNDQFRIYTALCNAYDDRQLANALKTFQQNNMSARTYDFICDDAVHDPLPQIDLCLMLWPYLKPGGIYAIEDVCPYKCTNGQLTSMARPLLMSLPDLTEIKEFSTHKDERLLLLYKGE